MSKLYTEKQLNEKIKLVEITVKGSYIARIDERRNTSKNYSVQVLVPEQFDKADIKRQTPLTLAEHPDFPDFRSVRTFEQDGKKVVKTDITKKRSEMMLPREVARNNKLLIKALEEQRVEAAQRKIANRGGILIGDTSDYGEDGLPPLVG